MRTSLLFLVLTLLIAPINAALVQSNSNLVFSSATATVTLPSVTAGHLLVLILHEAASAAGGCPTITVSDTSNGSWSLKSPGLCLTETTNIWKLQMWYFPNTAASAGTMTISAVYSLGGGFTRGYATVMDYSGVATVSPVDGSIPTELVNGSAGLTLQAPSKTTTNATDLLISYTGTVALQSVSPTIDSSFTVQVLGTATNIRSAEADRSVSATGTFAPIWTYGTSTLAMVGQVAFKLSSQIKGSVFIW